MKKIAKTKNRMGDGIVGRKPELCLLNKRIFELYARSAKIIDVAGYHCQVVNQCNRSNLFVYRMFGVW